MSEQTAKPEVPSSSAASNAAVSTSIAADQHPALELQPDAQPLLSSIQSFDDVNEILQLAEEFDLKDLRVVDHGVCVEITRQGGLGFEDGKLASPPAPSTVALPAIDHARFVAGDELVDAASGEDALSAVADGAALASKQHDTSADDGAVAPSPKEEKDPDTVYDSDFVVTSNRVGFFFSGAKNKPPLVNVGDHVDFNQPVCIIEQLGQQYVYLSEASGTVLKIFVEDGGAVEYGQQVMVIRPD